MPTANPEEFDRIRQLVQSGDSQRLIGEEETDYFEAKGADAYDLVKASDRYELAKDVSAFANQLGGLLVIGLDTDRELTKRTDVVRAVRATTNAVALAPKYLGILRAQVYPAIKGLEVTAIRIDPQSVDGLVVVHVPRQADEDKYFLMRNVIEEGERQKEIVFGAVKRVGADNVPLTIEQIYLLIHRAQDPAAAQLDRIERKLDASLARSALEDQKAGEKTAFENLQNLVRHMGGGS
jgi:predicted HTH transcriptional regulator